MGLKVTEKAENIKNKKRLSYEEQSVFLRQMAFVVKAGIPLAGAYEFLKTEAEENDHTQEKPLEGGKTDVLEQVFEHVRAGHSFSSALHKSGSFSEYLISVVELGEKTGNLEKALYDLANYFEQMSAVRRKIRGAFAYPLILLLMMTAVILFLIIEVLPQFAGIISGAGGELPPLAAGILIFGQFISHYYLYILAAIIFIVAALIEYFRSKSGKATLDHFVISKTVFGDTTRMLTTARFCFAMKMALDCGNSFSASVVLTTEVIRNSEVKNRLLNLRKRIDEGEEVPEAVRKIELFPKSFVSLFATAYKTGSLDETLERMSEYYQDSFDDAIYSITSKIEPVLVIVLSAIAAVILFSVMLPIINIMQLIG